MPRIRTLVVVLAGGAGGRLELLTHERAKPAVAFAGTHRLIDFPLSNCANSGIEDVWVSQQFNPISLSDHLANGRPWDLDRTSGGLLLLHPRQGPDDRGGFQQGTADGLWRFAPLIREFAPEALVVASADAVYAHDYGALVEEHVDSDADLTIVTTEVAPDDAARYGVVETSDGKVTAYEYKPEEPRTNLVANEVFVFRPDALLDTLEQRAKEKDELEDLGDDALPQLVDGGSAREHRFTGYWRDVGTVEAYWDAHRDLLGEEPSIRLDDPSWPILTSVTDLRAPARILSEARVENSLIAASARVAGTVRDSVLARGVTIEPGATVEDSVILDGVTVREGATVTRAILDERVTIGAEARVGEPGGEIALVGLRADVEPQTRLGGGSRFPEVG